MVPLKRYMGEMARAPFLVLHNLYRYRHILVLMVTKEIKGRFAGSVGGLLWSFVHPLLLLICYLFVFVYIFKLRVGAGSGAGASALYIMAGLFPWIIMAEGVSRGTVSVVENANLVQKTFFPTELLTVKAVVAPILSHGLAIAILVLYTAIADGFLGLLFFVPLVLLLQVGMITGVALIAASLAVFFRDVVQMVHVAVSFWIFLTPILYPVSMLPPWAQWVMYANPVYPFVTIYQTLFLEGHCRGATEPLLAVVWSLCFFVTGAFIFTKLKAEFPDWL